MYSSELDKLRREKEAQRSRAERLEDQASALQVPPIITPITPITVLRAECAWGDECFLGMSVFWG